MPAFNFNYWNKILGWSAFFIALFCYALTVEPTLSFWDCGEYIATAAKLEVGHPPGAPLYQMLGAFFAIFATSPDKIALMVNMMSVFSSAFTILFLFWSSTLLLQKIAGNFDEISSHKAIVILGSAFVGALAFTFSDSFWFNAVEAEVYAMASLFIALMFWLGLKWEADMHTPRGNKWMLMLCLMIGLSFGVHFMALLTIPAIGFLYYFKNYKQFTIERFVAANVIVIAILFFIFKLLLPWTLALFGKAEIFMVNSMGLPFNSGTIFMFVLIIVIFYAILRYTQASNMPRANTIALGILFILIGFSTWLMLPVRANANVVINENKPSDAAEVLAYYNREQYGVNPLFYGPQFSDMFSGLDQDEPFLDKKPNYERDYAKRKYIITNNYKKAEQNSDSKHKAILPRMWSTEHAENYMSFTKPVAFKINPNYNWGKELLQYGIDIDSLSQEDRNAALGQVYGEVEKIVSEFRQAFNKQQIGLEEYVQFLKSYGDYLIVEKPTASDNFKFMFEYQFGYMYWRYLMWNFVGRQNDLQGKYDDFDGNWLSGIKPIDELHIGSQDFLPDDVLNNKGRNTYYFLPFLLGILGLAYHAKKDLKSFYVLLSLFLFTGIALKIYLNERPFEPRERDYALVGSFYVFAIWIGFGVYALYEYLSNYLFSKWLAPAVLSSCLLAAPVLMATQNWDDHDRSDKYTALAMAKAYLNSCDQNAILFTIGDNDTFPLWYAQEIEKIRTDVKIVNTSLFMTDWYIDQMKMKTYDAQGLPISFKHNQYVGDKLDMVVYNPKTDARLLLTDFISFLKSTDERALMTLENGQKIHYYPTNKIRIPINRNAIIANKIVSKKYYDSIVPFIDVDINKGTLYKNRVMMLDVIANNDWKRPIYFTGGSFGDEDYLWMKEYLQLDGLVYKLVPLKTPMNKAAGPLEMGQIDADKMYRIVMDWDWGNGESPSIYHDPETRKNSITYRSNLARLMEQLINEKKYRKAEKVIDLAMEKMPIDYYGYYTLVEPFAAGYYGLGKNAKARKIIEQLVGKYQDNLTYYSNLDIRSQNKYSMDIKTDIERFRSVIQVCKEGKDYRYYNKYKKVFNSWNQRFKRFGRENE